MKFSVVIPVHNEEDNVEPLCSEIHAALGSRVDYEIIWVDDGSSDGTAEAVRRCMADARVRLLQHPRSFGQSAAVCSGVQAAHGEWIGTLDGDGQNDPADLPALLDRLERSQDPELRLVMGHRVTRHDSWLRRLSSRVANAVRARLLRDQTPDTGCGIKIFHRETFMTLPFFDHMHRFLPALFHRAGTHVVSEPVRHRPRRHGRSKYGLHNRLWAGLVDLLGVFWLQRRGWSGWTVTEERRK